MTSDDDITEDDLENEFREDPESGLEFLELYFRQNVFAYIKSRCPHFQPNELWDVYQDTMRRMVRAAQKPDFDPVKPMRLVQDIARKASIDAMKKKRLPPVGDLAEMADRVGSDMNGTKVAMEWRLILTEDMPAFRRALDEAIDELPPKQKVAAVAMTHVYEEVHDLNSYLPLRQRIQEVTGENLTTAQAYDNWREAREKIARRLRRAGFDLLEEE